MSYIRFIFLVVERETILGVLRKHFQLNNLGASIDCALHSPLGTLLLMVVNLTQETFLLATEILEFTLVRDLVNQGGSDGAVVAFNQLPSARGTSVDRRPAIFANDVTHWTLRNWKFSGDVETNWTLDAGSYSITVNLELIFGHSENYVKV